MRVAQIRTLDISNGPGVRISVFCSGCDHNCKGCFNTEARDFNYGDEFTDEMLDRIIEISNPNYVAGLSLLGGEPCHPSNIPDMTKLVKAFKEKYPDKTVWCWTGYLYDQVKSLELMDYLDVLVDGPFVEELKDLRLKNRGSSNQRIIDIKATKAGNNLIVLE